MHEWGRETWRPLASAAKRDGRNSTRAQGTHSQPTKVYQAAAARIVKWVVRENERRGGNVKPDVERRASREERVEVCGCGALERSHAFTEADGQGSNDGRRSCEGCKRPCKARSCHNEDRRGSQRDAVVRKATFDCER